MNVETLKKILDLMDERGVAEIEMRNWFRTVRISRTGGGANVQFIAAGPPAPEAISAPRAPAVTAAASPPTGETPASKPDADAGLTVIKSPMVGTFYRAPAPDAEPFVNVGTEVKKGQVLCIIEAMKIMNEIESDYAGVIAKIHVENGTPVQYGQVLFSLKAV